MLDVENNIKLDIPMMLIMGSNYASINSQHHGNRIAKQINPFESFCHIFIRILTLPMLQHPL